jgi:hypothetical protein
LNVNCLARTWRFLLIILLQEQFGIELLTYDIESEKGSMIFIMKLSESWDFFLFSSGSVSVWKMSRQQKKFVPWYFDEFFHEKVLRIPWNSIILNIFNLCPASMWGVKCDKISRKQNFLPYLIFHGRPRLKKNLT